MNRDPLETTSVMAETPVSNPAPSAGPARQTRSSNQPCPSYLTETSLFDRVNAWMVSANLLFGFLFLVTAALWWFSTPASTPTIVIDMTARPTDKPKPEDAEDETIGETEFTDLTEVVFERLQDSLPRLDQAIEDLGNRTPQFGAGSEPGPSGGKGGGGKRRKGPTPDKTDEGNRWTVRYRVDGLEQYKRQLDYFRIEIGVVHKVEPTIWRVGQFSGPPQVTLSSRQAENDRDSMFFVHQQSRLKRWGAVLAGSAGVSLEQAFTVEFYPPAACQALAQAEADYLASVGRSLDDVEKTEFRVEETGDGFRFVVQNMIFH